MSHKDLTRKHVLHVLATEWPDDGIIDEQQGLDAEKHTDEERAAIRNSYGNTLLKHEGRVFLSGGGVTLAGNGDSGDDGGRQVIGRYPIF